MTETPVIGPPPGERELEPGATLGEYSLVSLVGRGGMGEVWEAEGPDGQRVALKRIRDAQATPEKRRRFMREARAASAVDHPAVVRVEAVFEDDTEQPVMVMELLRGEPLAERLARDGELPTEEVATIMTPVLEAVARAHALGIIHRDLKPENIFLAETDGLIEPRVLDFGIAKLMAQEVGGETTAGLTTTGSLLGTPCYMAPEQVFGERDLDHRVDVWALGIILYQMLTGLLPTRADNVGQVLKIIVTRGIWPLTETAPDLPRPVTEMVDRMLSRERDDRPEDLAEVLDALRPFVDEDALPSRRDVHRSRPSIALVEPTVAQAPALTPPGHVVGKAAPAKSKRTSARLPWLVAAIAVVGSVSWVQSQPSSAPQLVSATAPPANASAPLAVAAPSATASTLTEARPVPASSASAAPPPPTAPPASRPSKPRLRPRPAPSPEPEASAPTPPPPPPEPNGGLADVPAELQ